MVEHLRERGESFVKDDKLVTCEETLLYGHNFPKDGDLTERKLAVRWRDINSESYVVYSK